MNRIVSLRRVSSSRARRIDAGWTVGTIGGRSAHSTFCPRCSVPTRNARPSRACAAVAPRQTIHPRLDRGISLSSHGLHAPHLGGVRLLVNAPLSAFGRGAPFEVLDRVCDEDVLRALDPRLSPVRRRQQASRRTDEGVPGAVFLVARLLADPGTAARGPDPPPKTVWVARRQSGHAWHARRGFAQRRQGAAQRWNARA